MKPETVQQFVDRLRSAKGKGIRYEDEHVRKKAGKAAKGSA